MNRSVVITWKPNLLLHYELLASNHQVVHLLLRLNMSRWTDVYSNNSEDSSSNSIAYTNLCEHVALKTVCVCVCMPSVHHSADRPLISVIDPVQRVQTQCPWQLWCQFSVGPNSLPSPTTQSGRRTVLTDGAMTTGACASKLVSGTDWSGKQS